MQSWKVASQSNDESLLSAIPDALTLCLNMISTSIEFREYGIQLCKTVLSAAQLKLLARGLSTDQAKAHIISPCLRLLTEIVSFDGGSFAKKVYYTRESTFKSLARNLALRRPASKDLAKKEGSVTVREHALQFLLTNLKFQDTARKGDLLRTKQVASALFRDIKHDKSASVMQVLDALERHVILDTTVSASTKSALFSERVLGRMSTLYGYSPTQEVVEGESTVRRRAHELLLQICTSPKIGVLLPQSGWYPRGLKEGNVDYAGSLVEANDRQQQHVELPGRSWEKMPVRNFRLATFVLTLRPYSDRLQGDLLLEIFNAAPELIADYFAKKSSFSPDPKLTATWIAYCAFFNSVIQMPVPQSCILDLSISATPPPIQRVIESILPRPLSQGVLTRCLNQRSTLISLFVIRLLILAFQKLRNILQLFVAVPDRLSAVWVCAASELKNEFCRRCPRMRDVIAIFRRTSEVQLVQQEAIVKLLTLYYTVTPQYALEEPFDVSLALSGALSHLSSASLTATDSGMRLLILEHLLVIGQRTSNLRWMHRPGKRSNVSQVPT